MGIYRHMHFLSIFVHINLVSLHFITCEYVCISYLIVNFLGAKDLIVLFPDLFPVTGTMSGT